MWISWFLLRKGASILHKTPRGAEQHLLQSPQTSASCSWPPGTGCHHWYKHERSGSHTHTHLRSSFCTHICSCLYKGGYGYTVWRRLCCVTLMLIVLLSMVCARVCVPTNADCISVSAISMQSGSGLSQFLLPSVEGRRRKKVSCQNTFTRIPIEAQAIGCNLTNDI